MTNRLSMLLGLVSALALVSACGGTDSGSGTVSCDFTTSGTHGCVEYSWTGGAYPTTGWTQACSQEGGTSGTACVHTGAVGGCKLVTTNSGITVTTLTWFYSGTVASIQTACSAEGGTFVAP